MEDGAQSRDFLPADLDVWSPMQHTNTGANITWSGSNAVNDLASARFLLYTRSAIGFLHLLKRTWISIPIHFTSSVPLFHETREHYKSLSQTGSQCLTVLCVLHLT
jgi:hypothetical protein